MIRLYNSDLITIIYCISGYLLYFIFPIANQN